MGAWEGGGGGASLPGRKKIPGLPSWDLTEGKTEKIDACFLQAQWKKRLIICHLGPGVSQLKNALLIGLFITTCTFQEDLPLGTQCKEGRWFLASTRL